MQITGTCQLGAREHTRVVTKDVITSGAHGEVLFCFFSFLSRGPVGDESRRPQAKQQRHAHLWQQLRATDWAGLTECARRASRQPRAARRKCRMEGCLATSTAGFVAPTEPRRAARKSILSRGCEFFIDLAIYSNYIFLLETTTFLSWVLFLVFDFLWKITTLNLNCGTNVFIHIMKIRFKFVRCY